MSFAKTAGALCLSFASMMSVAKAAPETLSPTNDNVVTSENTVPDSGPLRENKIDPKSWYSWTVIRDNQASFGACRGDVKASMQWIFNQDNSLGGAISYKLVPGGKSADVNVWDDTNGGRAKHDREPAENEMVFGLIQNCKWLMDKYQQADMQNDHIHTYENADARVIYQTFGAISSVTGQVIRGQKMGARDTVVFSSFAAALQLKP